jgi:outer membrane scaffolding protein for murein synthesis (MipA/OmpV family)
VPLLAGAILCAASPALAQEAGPPPPAEDLRNDPNSLTLGLGAAYAPSYEGSDNYIVTPIAIAFGKVQGFSFYTRGTTLYLDAIREEADNPIDFAFGPAVNIRFDQSTKVEDPRVEALGELDTAVEVGAFIGIGRTGVFHEYDSIAARIHYVRDITDTHGSYVITPAIEYGTPLSTTTYVGLSASSDYVGDAFAGTYYGVSPSGARRSGLRAFTPEGGFKNVRLSFFAAQSLTGDLRSGGLSLFGAASYSRMLGDFADAPIVRDVGDRNQYFASIGLSYSF